MLIQEVYPDTDEFIEAALLATPMAYEKAQTMVLVNGLGAGSTDPNTPCNGSLTIINVDPGKTYRMRVIGGTAVSINTIAFEGHDSLDIIEADGYVAVFLFSNETHNE
jgi:L-ascorbate oxidase